MSTQWDLVAYNRDNQLVLAVEVKGRLDATPEWAAQLRRNILAHGVLPDAPYFLMAFPDKFFLWETSDSINEPVEPMYIIDAHSILSPYLNHSNLTPEQVSSSSLELIVASWLNDIMHRQPNELSDSQQWLIDSGLYDAVAGGKLDQQIAA
jgi:hypothetical protein